MHPFHLHGHHFWLLATGQGVWNASEDPASYNLDNPPLRDTAILLPNGWTALRFVVCPLAHLSLQCMAQSSLIVGCHLQLQHCTGVCGGTEQAWLEQAPCGKPSRTMVAAKALDIGVRGRASGRGGRL